MASFLLIKHPKNGRVESINTDLVAWAEWNVNPDGCDGNLLVKLTNGDLRNVPFSHPDLPAAAIALGLKDQYEAWPKAKADAEKRRASVKAERDAQRARQSRGVRA